MFTLLKVALAKFSRCYFIVKNLFEDYKISFECYCRYGKINNKGSYIYFKIEYYTFLQKIDIMIV